jgi:hypothetical protein
MGGCPKLSIQRPPAIVEDACVTAPAEIRDQEERSLASDASERVWTWVSPLVEQRLGDRVRDLTWEKSLPAGNTESITTVDRGLVALATALWRYGYRLNPISTKTYHVADADRQYAVLSCALQLGPFAGDQHHPLPQRRRRWLRRLRARRSERLGCRGLRRRRRVSCRRPRRTRPERARVSQLECAYNLVRPLCTMVSKNPLPGWTPARESCLVDPLSTPPTQHPTPFHAPLSPHFRLEKTFDSDR